MCAGDPGIHIWEGIHWTPYRPIFKIIRSGETFTLSNTLLLISHNPDDSFFSRRKWGSERLSHSLKTSCLYHTDEYGKEGLLPQPYTPRGSSMTQWTPAIRLCAGALRKDSAGAPSASAAAHLSGFAAALLDGSGVRPHRPALPGNGERVRLNKVRPLDQEPAASLGAEPCGPQHTGQGRGSTGGHVGREWKGPRDFTQVAQPDVTGSGRGARHPSSARISPSPRSQYFSFLILSGNIDTTSRAGEVDVHLTPSLPERLLGAGDGEGHPRKSAGG